MADNINPGFDALKQAFREHMAAPIKTSPTYDELAARVAELERERDAAIERMTKALAYSLKTAAQPAPLDALAAQATAAQAAARDAARWRYVRDDPHRFGVCDWDTESESWFALEPCHADKIVDAAMATKVEGL
jgi:ClpP class serine protease